MAYSSADTQTIASFINQNLDNPTAIANFAYQNGIPLSDLANAAGVSTQVASDYFNGAGLNPQYFQPSRADTSPTLGAKFDVANSPFNAPQTTALGNINPANLTPSYGGYDQSFAQYTDGSNTYTPTFGGEMNLPISYNTTTKVGNDTVNVTYDANGNLMSATGQPFTQNGKQYVTDYGPNGAVSYREYAGPGNLLSGFTPLIGAAAAAFGVPGIIGSSLGLTGAAANAAGGAILGGGLSGINDQNILKGALIGGIAGYAGSKLGEYLNSGVTDPNLLQQAADADMAAGMLPEYGTNAAYDSAMANLMANSPGAVQQLQNFVDAQNAATADIGGGMLPQYGTNQAYDTAMQNMMANSPGAVQQLQAISANQNPISTITPSAETQVGGVYGPDNIDVGGGFNPATATTNVVPTVPAANVPGTPGGVVPAAAATTGGAGLLSKLTDNPLTTAAVVNSAAGLINNQTNKNAINNALNTQLAAGQQAGSTLKDIYNQQLGFVQPYQQAGLVGLNLLGQNQDYLTHQFDATDLAKGLAPNYNFMLQQGQMANQRAANLGGGALGGNALQGLQKFTQDYAGNAYQNAFNNYQTQRQNIFNTLQNIANMGQTANQQAIGAGTNYGQQQTNLATGLAAAQAGAGIGQAQNQTNLISNLANNVTLASLLGQKQSVA